LGKCLTFSKYEGQKDHCRIHTNKNCNQLHEIILTLMFFSTKIPHVVEELEHREDLREFLRIKEEKARELLTFTFSSPNSTCFIAIILRTRKLDDKEKMEKY